MTVTHAAARRALIIGGPHAYPVLAEYIDQQELLTPETTTLRARPPELNLHAAAISSTPKNPSKNKRGTKAALRSRKVGT